MARATSCQTPGTVYHTHIHNRSVLAQVTSEVRHKTLTDVDIQVELPLELRLSEVEAAQLEDNIHNALELVLAPYFREG